MRCIKELSKTLAANMPDETVLIVGSAVCRAAETAVYAPAEDLPGDFEETEPGRSQRSIPLRGQPWRNAG